MGLFGPKNVLGVSGISGKTRVFFCVCIVSLLDSKGVSLNLLKCRR